MGRQDGGTPLSPWRRVRPAAVPAAVGALGTLIAGAWILLFPAAESAPSVPPASTPSAAVSTSASPGAATLP